MLKIILAVGGIQVAAILIGLVRSKLVAVLLGPEGVGIVSVVDQVVQLVVYVSSFSLPMAAVRFLSKTHSEDDRAFREVYGAFLQVILMSSICGVMIVLLVTVLRPHWLGPDLRDYSGYFMIAALSVPAMTLGGLISNTLAAAQKARASALFAIVTNAGLAAGSIVGILLGGIAGMYVGLVAVTTALSILGLSYLKASLGLPIFDRTVQVARVFGRNPDVFFVSAMFAAGAIAASASVLVMRQAVLVSMGEVAAGLLQSAFALGLALSLVLNPTNGLYLTPIMNRSIEPASKLAIALDYQKRLAAILVLVSLPLVLFPQTAIYVLFSGRFTDAAQWVFLFVSAQIAIQFAGIYQAILIGLGQMRAYAIVTVLGHAMAGAAAWLLTPVWGVQGAGVGFLLGATASALMSFGYLRWKHGPAADPAQFSIVAFCFSAVLVVGGLATYFPEWTLESMSTRIVVYVALACAVLLFLTPTERSQLLYGLKRITAAARGHGRGK